MQSLIDVLILHTCSGSDFPTQLKATQLVGKLWSLCIKASTRAEDGSIDLYNEDAIAYAR